MKSTSGSGVGVGSSGVGVSVGAAGRGLDVGVSVGRGVLVGGTGVKVDVGVGVSVGVGELVGVGVIVRVGVGIGVSVGVGVMVCKNAILLNFTSLLEKADMTVAGALMPHNHTNSRRTPTICSLVAALRVANQVPPLPAVSTRRCPSPGEVLFFVLRTFFPLASALSCLAVVCWCVATRAVFLGALVVFGAAAAS